MKCKVQEKKIIFPLSLWDLNITKGNSHCLCFGKEIFKGSDCLSQSEQRFLPLAFHIFYVFSMRNYFPFYQKTKMADDRRILQELGSTEMSCTALSANVPAGVQGG